MTQPTPDPTFSVVINRTINAPRERVFEAWTNPAHLHWWWAVQEDFTVPIAEVDLRIGGSYRLGMQVPDQEHPFVVTGVYREISPPEKLVFTLEMGGRAAALRCGLGADRNPGYYRVL